MPHAFRTLTAVVLTAAGAMAQTCSCGANPPSPPRSRTNAPYANEPEDLQPFSKFTQPYYELYTKTTEYNGAASDGDHRAGVGGERGRHRLPGPRSKITKIWRWAWRCTAGPNWRSRRPTRAAGMAANRSC